jgi:uncharacterized protein (TIGR03083 family)
MLTSNEHDWLSLLRDYMARFADIVSQADLNAPITFCPGWSLRDLVVHLGGVHQWAAHAVVEGNANLQAETPERVRPELDEWYRRHSSTLLDVLAQRPPEAPAWTLDVLDPSAGFWWRRQVHETALHTWDAEEALGEPRPIDPALAWDGVVEVVDVLYPRQLRLGRIAPLAGAVRLLALDAPGDITLGSGEPTEVRATAEQLLRLLWHRADPDLGNDIDPRARVLLAGAVTP